MRVGGLRVTCRPRAGSWLVAAVGLAAVLGGCAAGTSRVEACIEHSVDEGVARAAAQDACDAAVGEDE